MIEMQEVGILVPYGVKMYVIHDECLHPGDINGG